MPTTTPTQQQVSVPRIKENPPTNLDQMESGSFSLTPIFMGIGGALVLALGVGLFWLRKSSHMEEAVVPSGAIAWTRSRPNSFPGNTNLHGANGQAITMASNQAPGSGNLSFAQSAPEAVTPNNSIPQGSLIMALSSSQMPEHTSTASLEQASFEESSEQIQLSNLQGPPAFNAPLPQTPMIQAPSAFEFSPDPSLVSGPSYNNSPILGNQQQGPQHPASAMKDDFETISSQSSLINKTPQLEFQKGAGALSGTNEQGAPGSTDQTEVRQNVPALSSKMGIDQIKRYAQRGLTIPPGPQSNKE